MEQPKAPIENKKPFEKLWRIAAHDLKTPLCVMNLQNGALQKHLPTLIAAYKIAQQHQPDLPNISDKLLNLMSDIPDTIKTQLDYTHWYLNHISKKIAPPGSINDEVFSISPVITAAINEYPDRYQVIKKHHRIQNHSEDFQIKGDRELLKHIFFNLLENSAYAIKASDHHTQPMITLLSSEDDQYHYLDYKEIASQIESDKLQNIFEPFYSGNQSNKMGLGLYFIKQTMIAFGGDIECQLENDEQIVFKLKFPKLSSL